MRQMYQNDANASLMPSLLLHLRTPLTRRWLCVGTGARLRMCRGYLYIQIPSNLSLAEIRVMHFTLARTRALMRSYTTTGAQYEDRIRPEHGKALAHDMKLPSRCAQDTQNIPYAGRDAGYLGMVEHRVPELADDAVLRILRADRAGGSSCRVMIGLHSGRRLESRLRLPPDMPKPGVNQACADHSPVLLKQAATQ